jgi:hypothetical protein
MVCLAGRCVSAGSCVNVCERPDIKAAVQESTKHHICGSTEGNPALQQPAEKDDGSMTQQYVLGRARGSKMRSSDGHLSLHDSRPHEIWRAALSTVIQCLAVWGTTRSS